MPALDTNFSYLSSLTFDKFEWTFTRISPLQHQLDLLLYAWKMSTIEGHRAYIVSGTDRAGLIVIAAGVWMPWMVLSLTTRLYTRIVITGPLSIDDLMASIGSVGTLIAENSDAYFVFFPEY